jgi:hypothetical protein
MSQPLLTSSVEATTPGLPSELDSSASKLVYL